VSVTFARVLGHALHGEGAHVEPSAALDGLDWRLAGVRPPGAPHSVFQLLKHMIYWQDLFLGRLTGASAPSPAHAAEGWPGPDSPTTEMEWQSTVDRFNQGLAAVQACVSVETLEEALPNWNHRTQAEAIAIAAAHNSYHIGQIVIIRRILGAWPPPTGGDTW
jgi:uncharacterized damage-inducible protein DinB